VVVSFVVDEAWDALLGVKTTEAGAAANGGALCFLLCSIVARYEFLPLYEEMRSLNLKVVLQGSLYALTAESNLYDRIVTAQRNDEDIQTIKQKLAEGDPKYTCF
jgi:hypothetical protein